MSTPEPSENPDTGRPDLRVVPEPEAPPEEAEAGDDVEEAEEVDEIAAEPVLDTDGNPAKPQAPLDVQLRETLIRSLHGIPVFGQSPASFAESIEYSQTGDWANSEKGAKRAAHGLATILAYLITYPLVDLLGKARTKPAPFVIAVAITVCLINVAALAL